MTAIVAGKPGFHELLSRMLKWRVNLQWYAVAILTTPLTVIASLLALSLFSPEFRPGFLTASDATSLAGTLTLPLGIVVGVAILTGFLEELGWTGFATPRLRLRYGVFATGFLMGLLWGAWHFVSNFLGSAESAGAAPLALYMLALLFTFLLPYRVLMVWVYDRTQSLLVAMLMHASLVVFWLTSMPPGITGAPQAIWYLVWAAVLWIVVATVAVMKGLELPRPQLRLRPA
jgi:membrane protease YdiL (CAAX protease family)